MNFRSLNNAEILNKLTDEERIDYYYQKMVDVNTLPFKNKIVYLAKVPLCMSLIDDTEEKQKIIKELKNPDTTYFDDEINTADFIGRARRIVNTESLIARFNSSKMPQTEELKKIKNEFLLALKEIDKSLRTKKSHDTDDLIQELCEMEGDAFITIDQLAERVYPYIDLDTDREKARSRISRLIKKIEVGEDGRFSLSEFLKVYKENENSEYPIGDIRQLYGYITHNSDISNTATKESKIEADIYHAKDVEIEIDDQTNKIKVKVDGNIRKDLTNMGNLCGKVKDMDKLLKLLAYGEVTDRVYKLEFKNKNISQHLKKINNKLRDVLNISTNSNPLSQCNKGVILNFKIKLDTPTDPWSKTSTGFDGDYPTI